MGDRLTPDQAAALGYRVEHVMPDGTVRSMTTKDGYLVVYGAPSYEHAVQRSKAIAPSSAGDL